MGLNGRSDDNAQLQPGPFMLEVIGCAELGRMAGWLRVDLPPGRRRLAVRKMTAARKEGARNGR